MPLATADDVAARLGRPILSDELPRIEAFLEDVTGLIEDYCGRDMSRREAQTFTLYPEGGCVLPVPGRYSTLLSVSNVLQEGQELDDWTYNGRQLVRVAGWSAGPVAVTGSWGYLSPPATLRAVSCSEVIRWLALSPGVQSERVGEVEVTFSGTSSTQSLSPISRTSLRTYRRRGAGSMTLVREGPSLDLRRTHVVHD